MNEQDFIVIIKNKNDMIEKHYFSTHESAWDFYKFYKSTLPPESSEKFCFIINDKRLWKRFLTLKTDLINNATPSVAADIGRWFDVISQKLDRDRNWSLIQENYNSKFGK